MEDYRDRAKRYHAAIREILLREWDPIGVGDIPQAHDEYDGYIPEIFGMLIRHASKEKLVDHLWWIETDHMALFGNRPKTEAIAARLCAVRDEIESGTNSE